MRWGVEKRLEFIEFRLYWEGGINRADIIEHFGVSVPQASKDLTLYEEKAPGNLLYDKSAKRYRSAENFKPVFMKPEAVDYLNQLQVGGREDSGPSESWLASSPEYDAMPLPLRRINSEVLRLILTAIRENRSIEIRYQSMNPERPKPEWRRITPHAFGNDGIRWHVRSFCHIDLKFKDFILSRCLGARHLEEPGAKSEDDKLWHEKFVVGLQPNPALSSGQQNIIAQDFAMSGDRIQIPVRFALLYYFQKRLRLDVPDGFDAPHERPVIVANRAEFDAALSEASR